MVPMLKHVDFSSGSISEDHSLTTEQIMFEPAGLEALNKILMSFLGESVEDDSSKRLTPEEKSILASAAEAYKAGHYHVAVTHYKTCVSSISKTYTHDNELSKEDVVLHYMLSKCLNQSPQFQDMIEARTILAELETSVGKIYPMIYYGLSELYVKIFCFEEAEQFIAKGFAVVKESTKLPDCYIPETNDLIPESTKQDLTEKLLNLKEQCSGWHPPDAKCFMDICTTVSPNHVCGKNIFIKSPAYNGMVTLICSNAINPCTITFHSVCWKIRKDEVSLGMKISDKEIILNWTCLTPNCGDQNEPSVIKKITIHKEDGAVKCIEPTVEKFNRNTQQQGSVSKGAIRKQKLMNKTSTPKAAKVKSVLSNNKSINVNNNNYNHSNHHHSQVNNVSNNTNIKNNSLVNEAVKEIVKNPEAQKPPSLIDPVTMKLMKMISLREENFNIEFENDWRPDEAYYGNEHMRSTIDSSYEPDFSNDPEHVAHIKSFLFSYFISYIENRGPIKNEELIKEWHEITESIGGCETIVNDLNNVNDVRQFLLQSLRFVAIGDYICIPALLPGAYALLEANVHHRVMNMLEKGDRDVDSKNERKNKRERKNSVSECNTQIKEEKIIKKEAEDIDDKIPADQLEEEDASEDKFLLCADDFLDTSGSDRDDCAASGSSTGSSSSYHSSIQVTDVKKNSERTGVEQHDTKIEGNEMIEDDEVREKPFEIQEEGIGILDEETSNDEKEGEDSADGYETDDTENQTSEESSGRAEEVVETGRASPGEIVEAEVENVPEETKSEEDNQNIKEGEAIDTYNTIELESVQSDFVQKTNNLPQTSDDYQSKSSNVSERYVIENESEETFDVQEDFSPDEDTEIYHPSEFLTPIEEEDSYADDENKDQRDYDAQQENDDAESSCSSTIDEVMNAFINMSSNKPQLSEKAPEHSESDVIAEQAAVIKELAEELKTTRDNLEKTTNELENMKMKMLKKSLDGQYSGNHTFISCKMEATRSDYAIVAKLQNIVFNTTGSYLNIDWQDWAMPLDKLEKIRSSLQDEHAKLASIISSKKDCEDMDDVRLNMLNVPTLPQHNIPDLIEVAFNTMKNRIQQSMVSCPPPILPPQNPHVPPMMSFWYQQTQFLQQPLPSGPYHHLINPLVASNQVPGITTPAQYPPSAVAMLNRSPGMVQPASPKSPCVIGQPPRYSTDQNANRVSWSDAPKLHAPTIPTEHKNVSVPVASKESSDSEAREKTREAEPVRTTPSPKVEHEGWKHAVPESSNSGQSKFSIAQNSTHKLKTCTPTVLLNDSLSAPQSHVKIVPKHTASSETQIPALTKSQSMDLPVKTAETRTIKTEKHNLLLVKYEFAKPQKEVAVQESVEERIRAALPLEAKIIIEDIMKKRTEISTQKPTILPNEIVSEKQELFQSRARDSIDSNEKKDSTETIRVSDDALINRFLSKNATATLKTPAGIPATDSSSSPSNVVAESIKDENAPTSLSNVPIKKSAPTFVEEKIQPRPIQGVNSGQSKIDQRTQKNAIQQSVTCEKPSTSGNVPIANGRSEVKTPEKPKMHSADKLMYILRKKHVGVLEYDLLYSVQIVRKNHNDTLSGLSFSQIVEEASQVINRRQKLQLIQYLLNNGPTNNKNQSLYVTAKSERPRNDSISSTSSINSIHRELITKMNPWNKPQDVSWRKDSPELECVICMEVLITYTNEPTYTLKCQHTFHKQCIKNWFTQNQSCPTCRIHSTIDDEFPPLA